MRILVTGGAGFIGSRFCERLALGSHDVIVVDNLSTGNRNNLSAVRKKVEFISADVAKKLEYDGGIDIIAHLASPASPADFSKMQLEIAMVNAIGTKNALDLAVKKNAAFLMASTSEVYGNPLVHPQREDYFGNVNPAGPRSCYDESKRFAETLCYIYSKKFGLNINIARIFNTYGPGMRPDDGRAIPNFIMQALQNKPLTVYGDGKQTRSFCYIDDLVDGLHKLAFHKKCGTFNIGNPDERALLEIAELVIKFTGSSSKIVHLGLPEDDPVRRCPDITKARKELKWHPKVSLEEGLKKNIAYVKNHPS